MLLFGVHVGTFLVEYFNLRDFFRKRNVWAAKNGDSR